MFINIHFHFTCRLNERILSTKSSTFIDLTGTSDKFVSRISAEDFSVLKAPEMTGIIADSCHYITTKSDPAVRPLTVWIVGDFDTQEGRALLLEAVKYLVSGLIVFMKRKGSC